MYIVCLLKYITDKYWSVYNLVHIAMSKTHTQWENMYDW